MAYQAKLPPGGLRAAVENNLRDRQQQQQDLTLVSDTTLRAKADAGTEFNGDVPERFKTIRLERQDYEGADETAANCPVSRAIRRALKKGPETRIHIWVDRVRIGANIYALPAEATAADRAYTSNGTVTELEFQLSNRRVTT